MTQMSFLGCPKIWKRVIKLLSTKNVSVKHTNPKNHHTKLQTPQQKPKNTKKTHQVYGIYGSCCSILVTHVGLAHISPMSQTTARLPLIVGRLVGFFPPGLLKFSDFNLTFLPDKVGPKISCKYLDVHGSDCNDRDRKLVYNLWDVSNLLI